MEIIIMKMSTVNACIYIPRNGDGVAFWQGLVAEVYIRQFGAAEMRLIARLVNARRERCAIFFFYRTHRPYR